MTAIANLAVKNFDFGIALAHLKRGKRVARSGWNGKDMWLTLFSDNWSGATTTPNTMPEDWQGYCPFIGMYTADKRLVPWLASQTDMLATDWQVVG